jgi:Uri superfamily endonuclease
MNSGPFDPRWTWGTRVGTYLLELHLGAEQRIRVGSLGEIRFPAGFYLYAGSALGPGGLQARLARHLRRRSDPGTPKKLHWHVDYVREHVDWQGAWIRAGAERLECAWAAAICCLSGAEIVARGFGASDCGCRAHLVHLPTLPDDAWFAQVLGAERSPWGAKNLTCCCKV